MEVFSFIFGAVFGSFLNVLIIRLPKEQSFITPRSKCQSCDTIIPWYYNIPIISYLVLRGKCHFCKESFSINYFFVELITGIITMLLFMEMGLSVELLSILGLFYTLIVLSVIDINYKAVPDYLLLLALILSFFATSYSLIDAFQYAFLYAGAFVLLNFIITFYIQNIKARILKDESLREQEALGEGDIPIVAIIGVMLGLQSGLSAIFLAAVFAILPSLYSTLSKKDIEIPFIPFLFLGLLVEYFFDVKSIIKAFV